MLYAIQVRTGSENTTIDELKTKISGKLMTDVYTPLREERYKEDKKWKVRYKVLFPGYIFIETEDIMEVIHQLNLITRYTRVITMDREPISVRDDELVLIDRLTGGDHVVEVSEGIIVGDKIKVLYGPLLGLEGLITKINRHKRKAWIDTNLFGRQQVIKVGLEITEKIE